MKAVIFINIYVIVQLKDQNQQCVIYLSILSNWPALSVALSPQPICFYKGMNLQKRVTNIYYHFLKRLNNFLLLLGTVVFR